MSAEMGFQEYQIDFGKSEVYECGATLVALLAHPTDAQDVARGNLHAPLCALAVRAQFYGQAGEFERQSIKPIYALRAEKEISKDLKTLKRRLRGRMGAARIAMAYLQLAPRQPPRLPAGVRRLSLNQMSELVFEDAGQSDSENVEKRIWRPSLPVIHLAAATAVMIDVAEKEGFGRFTIGELLCCRPLIEAIVREAQAYEPLIQQSRHFPSTLELVRLRLTGE